MHGQSMTARADAMVGASDIFPQKMPNAPFINRP